MSETEDLLFLTGSNMTLKNSNDYILVVNTGSNININFLLIGVNSWELVPLSHMSEIVV